ncbi:unnamed protein product [Bursaphelenchus xylophilus]|uniref:(pine wood nematode) hypothetical protein n=1 Tax=Bursaphelenchus xylophilus TaxID=6326 RepID=A0A1I7SA66_BURXY|nr:unnamed protein product [Bursaphelenchus xylophilus]CAG9131855.1 unnamed protein product [Bursaphelenchus xylophilus]
MDNSIKWLSAGAGAGLAVDLSLYPLDTLKTRLQSKAGFKASGGFSGVYRGMGSVAMGSAPGAAAFFLTYQMMKSMFGTRSPLVDATAASCGEITACLIRVPTEIVKQRAQVSKKSVMHIAARIFKSNGITGFYKGYGSTLAREIPFAFIQYPLWEELKRRIAKRRNLSEATPLQSAAAGSVSGSLSAGLTTPLDVVKTRIMLGTSKTSNPFLTLVEIFKSEGIRPLFSGFTPRCAWMGIGGFVYFFSYEFCISCLNRVL